MTNLRDDLKAAFLGATGGLFSFSVFLLVARVDTYYKFYLPALRNTPFLLWHTVSIKA